MAARFVVGRVVFALAFVFIVSGRLMAQQSVPSPAGAPAYAAAPAPATPPEAPEATATGAAEAADPPAAAGEELIAGRPGFVESRGVVQAGVLQLEGGWSYAVDGRSRTSTMPGGVLRLGLGHGVELRGANLGFSQTSFVGGGLAPLSGASDAQVGAKVMLLSEQHAPFELAVEPMLSIPIGAAGVTTTTYDPSLTFSMGRALPAGFDATGLVRASRLTTDGERLTQFAAAVSVAHDVWKPWTASTEVVMISGPAAWSFSTALARHISQRCQIDVEIGHGLSSAAPAWTFGAGIVVR